jgi:hypothetical protein
MLQTAPSLTFVGILASRSRDNETEELKNKFVTGAGSPQVAALGLSEMELQWNRKKQLPVSPVIRRNSEAAAMVDKRPL